MPVGAVWFAYHPHGMWARLGRVLVDDGPMGRSIAVILLAAAWVATWRPQVDPDAWWHVSIGKAVLDGRDPGDRPVQLADGGRSIRRAQLAMGCPDGHGLRRRRRDRHEPSRGAGHGRDRRCSVGAHRDRGPGRSRPFARSVLVVLGVVASLPLWAPRGQTLDVLFVLATAFAIASYLRLGTRTALFALPVIGVLWANLHGSALLGLVAILAIGLLSLPIGARWGVWPRPRVAPLAVAALASLVAAMVNPYGPALLALSVRSRGGQRVLVRHHRMALTGLPFPGAAGCPSADREPSPARRRLAAAPA